MGSRLQLQDRLEDILYNLTGKKNVYHNAPGISGMDYPAIKFSTYRVDIMHADNCPYKSNKCYTLTVIGKLPNDKIVEELLKLPMCSYDRPYTSNGLFHDVLHLYY